MQNIFISKSKKTHRSSQIAKDIKVELSKVLSSGQLHHPMLFDRTLLVTEVLLSSNLAHAKVYVYPFKQTVVEQESKFLLDALKVVTPLLRSKVGKALSLRFIPQFEFFIEDQYDKLDNMNYLTTNIDKSAKDKK